VETTLALRTPFEMLYGIRDVRSRSINTRVDQSLIEQPAGRADKRLAR
jgi:hypothetical protein